jgi:hypothetical protein
LSAVSTGVRNTAVGYNTGAALSTGTDNTLIGNNAGAALTTTIGTIAIGSLALDTATTATQTVAVGYSALTAVTTGANNTAVGYNAGSALTTGTGNVIIGNGAAASAVGGVNQIVIGNSVTGQADSNVTLGSSGGKIYNAFTVNATWTFTSDMRLKTDVQPAPLGLSFIKDLKTVTYRWKPSNEIPQELYDWYNEENQRDTTTVMHGMLAQDVKTALDKQGVTDFAGWDVQRDGTQSISREMFVIPLIKAVQELSAQVEALKAEVETLKGA